MWGSYLLCCLPHGIIGLSYARQLLNTKTSFQINHLNEKQTNCSLKENKQTSKSIRRPKRPVRPTLLAARTIDSLQIIHHNLKDERRDDVPTMWRRLDSRDQPYLYVATWPDPGKCMQAGPWEAIDLGHMQKATYVSSPDAACIPQKKRSKR